MVSPASSAAAQMGVQVGMVDGVVDRQAYPDALRPRGVRVALDLQHGALDVARGGEDERVQAPGVAGAHVIDLAVDAAEHRHVDGGVGMAGRRAGHHEVHVHALLVHVAHASIGIPVGAAGRGDGEALEVLEVALSIGARARLPKDARGRCAPTALIAEAVKVGVGLRHLLACPAGSELTGLQLVLHVAEHGVEEGLERLGGGVEVRIRVEYPIAVAHGDASL